jgi:hypothetical protein
MGFANGSNIAILQRLLEFLSSGTDIGINREVGNDNRACSFLTGRGLVQLKADKLTAIAKGNANRAFQPCGGPRQGKCGALKLSGSLREEIIVIQVTLSGRRSRGICVLQSLDGDLAVK